MKHLHFIRMSAVCGIIFPIVSFLFILLLGYLTPGYSQVGDYISQIWATGSRFEGISMVLLALIGFMSIIFSIGFYLAIDEDKFSYYNLLLLIIFSVSLIFLGIFPCYDTCAVNSITLHFMFTLIACASLGFSPLLLYFVAKQDKEWESYRKVSLAVFFVSSVALISYFLFLDNYKGLFQRAYFLVCFLWVEIISIKLFKLTKTSQAVKKRLK